MIDTIIDKQINCIKKLQLGFVEKDETSVFMLSVFSHFKENHNVFNGKQLISIDNILSQILEKL